jgi:hypothetical protein
MTTKSASARWQCRQHSATRSLNETRVRALARMVVTLKAATGAAADVEYAWQRELLCLLAFRSPLCVSW